MIIQKNVNITEYSTFGLRARTEYCLSVDTHDLYDLSEFINDVQLPTLAIGGGSNTIFSTDFPGVLIKVLCSGTELSSAHSVTVGAGENWDIFVQWTIANGLYGLEVLSGIPGNVGGAVALNAGAFGIAIEHVLYSLKVYDINSKKSYHMYNSEIGYKHRTSVFRDNIYSGLIILEATFTLNPGLRIPNHPIISSLDKSIIHDSSQLRSAILNFRSHLPNIKKHNYCGSFFLNPIVTNSESKILKTQFAELMMKPYGTAHQQISAGWLLDYCGFKGTMFENFIFHKNHANHIINTSKNTNGEELYKLIAQVQQKVWQQFRIEISPEPIII